MRARVYKIQEIVALPEWQEVRQRLVGQWKKRPEWAVGQLREFLGPVSEASDRKLRIMLNYLTGSGFRLGVITHPEITKLRDQVRAEIASRKEK